MGRDKATLRFGSETMLERVVRLVGQVVPLRRIVCVAADGQSLPPLPNDVRTVRDRRPNRGPLEGLAAGLAAVHGQVDAAFVTGCDAPMLQPDLIGRLFELLGEFDMVVPRDGEFHHPLTAVYRTSLLPTVDALLAEGKSRLLDLPGVCHALELPVDELRDIDPELASFESCNRPEDLQAALRMAGVVTENS
jgi:molybdopterin-guanine dinucleotide biosynthesis protein A